MNWINLNVTFLDSEEFISATPVQRATWLCLLRYCAGQENSGRIEGAKLWKDRMWLQVVRVRLREITVGECRLWEWQGDDLVVNFYPTEKEAEVRKKRTQGSLGGRGRTLKKQAVAAGMGDESGNHMVSGTETTCLDSASREREEEGKEKRKGKGMEMEDTPKPPKGDRVSIPADEADEEAPTLPRRWRLIPRSERKNHRVHRNNVVMQRIGTWFGRRPESLWNVAEGLALTQLDPPRGDVDLLERYYLAPLDRTADYRRRDLLSLLSHWHAELDRARIWEAEGG
ncbi:hypothetical protein [Luteolibacter luteus]|uniref:Uncharacterized protein n=1 Tax=Luteolibacter luteus TaxID=2728835 RepID=A0A858RR17_9BACT|nr:hypothetical protein [Luteolibacter luteus]QJE99101.1 hypothetical protein HHL09_26085 [Luteolibacter luteus]